jgi:hypothetical protein
MWSNQKMKSLMFIHNDNVKCFHMAVHKMHKLVMMGRINFEDHALIKRWQANEKMNVTRTFMLSFYVEANDVGMQKNKHD